MEVVTERAKRERDIEDWLRRRIESMGGIAFKFTSTGNDGVPDRIVILPGGQVWFIELKTVSGKLSALQGWQIERMKKLGARVAVIRGMDGARSWWTERLSEMAGNGREAGADGVPAAQLRGRR